MTISIHIARVGVFNVDPMGNVLKKDDPSVTLRQQMQTSTNHLVIEDSAIPNSANHPTVQAYIAAEALNDYVVHYMDQTTIISYLRTASGGFG